MKISIHEAFSMAKFQLPKDAFVELSFFNEDEMNNRIIYALAKEAGSDKTAIWLTSFGICQTFADGKRLVEKAQKLFEVNETKI